MSSSRRSKDATGVRRGLLPLVVGLVMLSCCRGFVLCPVAAAVAPGSSGKSKSCLSSMPKQATLDSGVKTGTAGWAQKTITVTAPSRGCHLITSEITRQFPELSNFSVGMANIFIKHTSASLTLNENADPDVRTDMEAALNKIVPVEWHSNLFTHTLEGPDDMAGHVKSSLLGSSVNVPVSNGRLNLGTWQGVYLCEHRDTGGYGGGHARNIVITVQGLV